MLMLFRPGDTSKKCKIFIFTHTLFVQNSKFKVFAPCKKISALKCKHQNFPEKVSFLPISCMNC